MKTLTSLSPENEAKKSDKQLAPVRAPAQRPSAPVLDDAHARAALEEKATQPARAKAAVETGYEDLIGAAQGSPHIRQREHTENKEPSTQKQTQITEEKKEEKEPLMYHSVLSYDIGLPSEGFKSQSPEDRRRIMTKWLDDKKKDGAITSAEVSGFDTDIEEFFVYYALWAYAGTNHWGYEIDLQAAIGWPEKPGDAAPMGLITVRIDHKGAASAELVRRGAVSRPAAIPVADAKKELKSKYGFNDVRDDGTASWTDQQLSDVVEALKLLPEKDRSALKGLDLVRVAHLSGAQSVAGTFSHGSGVERAAVNLDDDAFKDTSTRFYGNGSKAFPNSYQTILHEVAHAIETLNYRKASENRDAISKDLNESAKQYKKKKEEHSQLYAQWEKANKAGNTTEANRLAGEITKVVKEKADQYALNQQQSANLKAAETTLKNAHIREADLANFKKDGTEKKTAADLALKTAQNRFKALSADEQKSGAAYKKAVLDLSTAIAKFVKGAEESIATEEEALLKKQTARDQVRAGLDPKEPVLAIFDPAAQAQNAWLEAERALAWARKRTRRLQKFVDLVDPKDKTRKPIKPLTKYATENWPLKPGEFYAEAYSLWLLDKEFMKTNYPRIFDFFENGDYLKP